MKKLLSILGLFAILSLTTPVMAAPGGPGGPGGGMHGGLPGPGGGHRIHAGANHRPHMSPHHHGGLVVHTGYPRHSHWHGYRSGYWGNPWCDYRLGCCPYHYPGFGVHIPMGGASFSIRF